MPNSQGWGEFTFKPGQMRHWQLGPMRLWISRTMSEFHVTSVRADEENELPAEVGLLVDETPPEDSELIRFGVRDSVKKLIIVPVCGDRAAVVKSRTPYIVPAGGATTAFVNSPVWLQMKIQGSKMPLHEIPTWRPSDTWFGPSTIVGELCYAIRSSMRYNLENVPVRHHRAISVVHIKNHADSPLELTRLRMPLPNLSLFSSADGRLWTESVTLDRKADGDLAEVKLGSGAPNEAGSCQKVSGPRQVMDKKFLIRSFTGLLGLSKGKDEIERTIG